MPDLQRLRQQAQRHEHPIPGGALVWHQWSCLDPAAHRPPLVLLHGGSGSWTHWAYCIDALRQTHELWALDLPGMGDSSLPPDVWDADDLPVWLQDAFAARFAPGTFVVVGFSFGGLAAGLWAAQYPHMAQALVLVGVPGLGLMGERLPMRGFTANMTPAQERDVHAHNLGVMMLHDTGRIDARMIDLQAENVARDRMRRRRIARSDVLVPVSAQWQVPVHAIWGARDSLYEAQLHRVPEVLPQLRSNQYIAEAGHWVMAERPDEFVGALMRALGVASS